MELLKTEEKQQELGGGAVPGTEPGALDSIPSPSKAKKDEGSHLGKKKSLLSQESNSANQGSILCPLCPVLGTPT